MSKPSPTSRTLAECKRRGWPVQIVERWVPQARRRIDLFGCIDLIAIKPTSTEGPAEIIGIQACAGASHSARRAKAILQPHFAAWICAGGRFAIWSWSKRGERGKRKVWQLREEYIVPGAEQ